MFGQLSDLGELCGSPFFTTEAPRHKETRRVLLKMLCNSFRHLRYQGLFFKMFWAS